MTETSLKNSTCIAIRRKNGKCIRAGSKMLVEFKNGVKHVVLARLLRKIENND